MLSLSNDEAFCLMCRLERMIRLLPDFSLMCCAFFFCCASALRAEIRLSENLTDGDGVRDLWISPDQKHAVYSGDLTVAGKSMLYAVNLETLGTQTQINGLVHPNGSSRYESFGFTADSRRFIYYSYFDRGSGQMWPVSVPLDTTGPSDVRVVDDSSIDVSESLNAWFTPDRERLIIRAIDPAVGDFDYFSFSVDGGEPAVKVSSAPTDRSSFLEFGPYAITENEIFYVADFDVWGEGALYKASLTEPDTQIRIGTRPADGGSLLRWIRVADAVDRVVFTTHSGVAGRAEVQSAGLDGAGDQIQISSLPDEFRIGGLQLILNDSRALYRTFVDLGFGSPRNIYSASTTETGTQFRINQASNRVSGYQPIADGSRVFYTGRTSENHLALYAASTTLPGTEIQINQAAEDFSSTVLLGDGDRVLYVGRPTDGTETLYVASTTVANTELTLFESHNLGGRIRSVTPIRGGDRALFYGDPNIEGVYELFSIDTYQPGSVLRISGPPVSESNTSVGSFAVAPDESRVVYQRGSDAHVESAGLFSAPVDQDGAEQNLLLISTPKIQIDEYLINSKSQFVVAKTRVHIGDVGYRNALFAVPIDGGVPVRIHDDFVTEGRIHSLTLLVDSDRLVYLADSDVRYDIRYDCGPGACRPDLPPDTPSFLVRVGIPDVFVAVMPNGEGILGDMNGDSVINLDDIQPFVVGLRFPEAFAYSFGLDAVNFGDMNGDGVFDEGDIVGFAVAASVEEAEIRERLNSLFADFNRDGVVDFDDYFTWASMLGQSGTDLAADAAGNGVVDHGDIYIWQVESGLSIPEPVSAATLSVALVALALTRQKAESIRYSLDG